MKKGKKTLNFVDLFAGCGGLSLGLKKAGFKLELAVEISEMACETFFYNLISNIEEESQWTNFCKLPIEKQAEKGLINNSLKLTLNNKNIISSIKKSDIDLVVGGPPCQGFSMAGRRNPKDSRNLLPWEFLEFIEKTSPKAVIMENVLGMTRNFNKHNERSPFSQIKKNLEETGNKYKVQAVQLNSVHFGVPQHRSRIMLFGFRKDIADYARLEFSEEVWKSDYDFFENKNLSKRPTVVPRAKFFGNKIRTSKEALWDIDDYGYKYDLSNSFYQKNKGGLAKFLRTDRKGIINNINKKDFLKNHTSRNHNRKTIERFVLYQYLQKNNVSPKILNIPLQENTNEEKKYELLKKDLKNVKIPAKSLDGAVIAKNKKKLIEVIFKLATKKHSQRPINLEKPSPTILTLPDDYIHPRSPRILTVREMARLMSFPDSFEFRSKETTGSNRRQFEVPQYTQVGNAVTPFLAFEIGRVFYKILSAYNKKMA